MKQHKISNWLKGLDIILAIMLLIFFVGATIAIHRGETVMYHIKDKTSFIVFVWYTASCCFIVLAEFWKVCTQIGLDNSFSMENSAAFRHMAICGIAAAIGFAGRMVWLICIGNIALTYVVVITAEIMLSLMFAVLAEAMSRLVINAYEVKHENELTI